MIPHARQDKLLVQEVGDELVVYDQERHRAHRLNRTAALIWRHCDGHKTATEMATLLQDELKLPADEGLVWLALDRLEKAHLLQESVTPQLADAAISRRDLMRKLGLTGGLMLLLPVVTSINSPTLAQTVSPGPRPGPQGDPDDGGGGGGDGAAIAGAAGGIGLIAAARRRRGCRTDSDCPANAPFCVDIDPETGRGHCRGASQQTTVARNTGGRRRGA